MFIRSMTAEDIPAILALHEAQPLKYGLPSLDGDSILHALVMVDENDVPRALLAAEKVAELFLVLDPAWETPAFRAVAIAQLAGEIRTRLESNGVRAAYAFLGEDVPRGYQRRLEALGAGVMEQVCMKFEREGA